MAIKINLQETETELFCSSKWWGDPDLPADMEYPTAQAEEDGETFDYPLTFICQIDCEDIAPFDPEGKLLHQGMFYVFAGLDEYLDLDSPWHNGLGLWDKKQVVVKYTKAINFETFRSAILVDDDDQPLTQPALKMTFEACPDNADCTKLLGFPFFEEVLQEMEGYVNFLQIDSDTAGLRFYDEGMLNLLYKNADLAAGKWKLVKGYMTSC
ncbi:MAG: DUF1963 domain-containing protein [Bacteroidales bacterium]|nr:DUF1963 domain-containing protein [Bacteroidales bacterium]